MAEETQYTANTGKTDPMVTSNSYLNGDAAGTYYTVITADAGASGKVGLLINSITIKATTDTTQSMVRLFINDGAGTGTSHTFLISEIEVPAVIKSATDPAFELTIPVDYALKCGWKILASVEFSSGSPSFNVIAEGMDWKYYTTSVRPDSSKYTANTGTVTVTTANTALDGSGTVGTDIFTVITGASNGTMIQSVTIKSVVTGAISAGMIRLFINDGGGSGTTYTKLLTEIPVEAITQSGTSHSFSKRVDFGGRGFFLQSGWILRATSQTGDDFNVIAEGLDLTYPA